MALLIKRHYASTFGEDVPRQEKCARIDCITGLDSRIDDVVLARLAESTEGHYVARQPVLCYEHEIERTLPSRPKDILTEFKGDFRRCRLALPYWLAQAKT